METAVEDVPGWDELQRWEQMKWQVHSALVWRSCHRAAPFPFRLVNWEWDSAALIHTCYLIPWAVVARLVVVLAASVLAG